VRFLFCDRVLTIEKKKFIAGVKTFSLAEEYHQRSFAIRPLVPGVLQIEAMAQFLGWLINYSYDFRVFSIISLIQHVEVSADLRPGFVAEVHAEIVSTTEKDSLGKAWIEADGARIAAAERMIYTHLGAPDPRALEEMFRYNTGLK
jgi:3-hydroxyacyl-[acyl-carrier-protein] dehydratase